MNCEMEANPKVFRV